MPNTRQPSEPLGGHVKKRRLQLGLSATAAARAAGVSRGTWIALETGTRETETHKYAAIERVLNWAPGSIDNIRDGGTPTEAGTTPDEPVDDLIAQLRAIATNPRRSHHLRVLAQAQIEQLQAVLEADQAEDAADRRTG